MRASQYLLAVCFAAPVMACTTTRGLATEDRLEIYRTHAQAPVDSFRHVRHVDRWTQLGDEALAVWATATSGYLIELDGSCDGLQYAINIELSDRMGTVMARADTVTPVGAGAASSFPCRIREIRPVDQRVVRAAEKHVTGT